MLKEAVCLIAYTAPIEQQDGSVRLIRRDAPAEVLELLVRPRHLGADVRMSASAAVAHVVAGMIRDGSETGIVGSGPSPDVSCALGAPVSLPEGSTTAEALLDRIVAQAPGLSWFVTYDGDAAIPAAKLQVGLWCPDGLYFLVEVER